MATALFDYIGECLCGFVAENNLVAVPLPLGFTFSFPMHQHSLSSATLAAWAKSFNLPTVIGRDVVELLRESLAKLGHNHIDVVAILNDTTSTLVRFLINSNGSCENTLITGLIEDSRSQFG